MLISIYLIIAVFMAASVLLVGVLGDKFNRTLDAIFIPLIIGSSWVFIIPYYILDEMLND